MHELYYPEIEIPSNSWLKRALLTKEKVSTIAPSLYIDGVSNTYKHIKNSTDLLEYQNINTFDYNSISEASELMRNLMNKLPSASDNIRNNMMNKNNFNFNIVSPKLINEIIDFSVDEGLAFRSSQNAGIMTTRSFAYLYMNFLSDRIINNQRGDLRKTTTISKEKKIQNLLNEITGLDIEQENIERLELGSLSFETFVPISVDKLTFRQIINLRNDLNFRKNIKGFNSVIERLTNNQINMSQPDLTSVHQDWEELLRERKMYIAQNLGWRMTQGMGIATTIYLDNIYLEAIISAGLFKSVESKQKENFKDRTVAINQVSQTKKIINRLKRMPID